MTEPLLRVTGLGKRFGGFIALDAVDLVIAPGERVGLIGPNGSGKSTFVNCLSGTLRNEVGHVVFDGHPLDGLPAHRRTRLGLARSFQLPRPFVSLTVGENLRVPIGTRCIRSVPALTPMSPHGARNCCPWWGLPVEPMLARSI